MRFTQKADRKSVGKMSLKEKPIILHEERVVVGDSTDIPIEIVEDYSKTLPPWYVISHAKYDFDNAMKEVNEFLDEKKHFEKQLKAANGENL